MLLVLVIQIYKIALVINNVFHKSDALIIQCLNENISVP
jgi:hypothetical protein